MISVTGIGLSRARLGDRFSAYSCFARRAFLDRNDRPSRMVRTSTRGSSFVGVTRDAPGFEDELLLVPVIIVDVRAIEALDHLGGAGAGHLADHPHRLQQSASSRHNHGVSSPLWVPTANQCPHTGATNAHHRNWVRVLVGHRQSSLSVGEACCRKERESPPLG